MENLESKGVLGSFKLSESVISTIVATAATEVPGVACMASFEPNFKNISTIKNILNTTCFKTRHFVIHCIPCFSN
ncbi:MAG: hypothetical protein ACI4PK_04280, partial [Oscillospiraceae bacterium]